MNADDYMLAKQLRDEVDEFFRINRGHIESNFVGYRAAGPVSKAIYSFAEAGLDGTLWSDTTTGPRVIIYQGDNIPIALSYNDFKSGRTQRMKSRARRYRRDFNIKSDPINQDTADYILANPDHPLHGLYSGLVDRYNGYLSDSRDKRLCGEMRDKAAGNASIVRWFISMLAPVQKEFHMQFEGDSVCETAFWESYYRNFSACADKTHMTHTVKAYLNDKDARDAEGNLLNPDVWMLKLKTKSKK